MSDINEFFRKNVDQKRKPVGSNSFVAPHSAYEYQMDLFFINDLKDQKFRVGMLMIDIFDKFMHVVAIKGKKEEDLASGMIECLNKMGQKPIIIYTDDEGAMNKEAIQKYLQEQNIEHHRTRAQISARELLGHSKIYYIVELKPIRKRVKTVFSGRIIFLKHY